MSSNEFGTLGAEMKAMKDGRKNLMAQTKTQGRKRKADTNKFLADTGAANAELRAETHQILADADKMMTGIAKDVAGLKAETQQMLSDAHGQTAEMTTQMRQTLAPVKAELGAQNRQFTKDAQKMMTGIAKDVAGLKAGAQQMLADHHEGTAELKAQTHQILADADKMMTGLTKASHRRAAAWRDVLQTVRGNGAPARSSAATAVMAKPKTKAKAKPKTKAQAKKR